MAEKEIPNQVAKMIATISVWQWANEIMLSPADISDNPVTHTGFSLGPLSISKPMIGMIIMLVIPIGVIKVLQKKKN